MGDLRIIAGQLKGRRIRVAAGVAVRPTAERVREALFSILGPTLAGARVLDAYAGTGALGFEALSRGAGGVVFVESDPAAVRELRRHALRFDVVDRCRVLAGEVVGLAARGLLEGPFDLVLADPPYGTREGPRLLRLAGGLLAPGGRLVMEREAGDAAGPAEGLERVRSARYGRVCLDFYLQRSG